MSGLSADVPGAQGRGSAGQAQVLEGYGFSANSGNNLPGAMPERGAPTLYPFLKVPPGHYEGGYVVFYPAAGVVEFSPAVTYATAGSLPAFTAGSSPFHGEQNYATAGSLPAFTAGSSPFHGEQNYATAGSVY